MMQCSTLLRSVAGTAVLVMTPLSVTVVSAQSSTTRGLNLGIFLEGAALSVEGGDANGGGGLGLRVGYGFNRIVTGFLNIDGTTIEVDADPDTPTGDWRMAHVDLGARFHFANTLRSWVPWLEAALTARAVGLDPAVVNGNDVGSLSFSGAAFTVGGGLSVYLKETLALDIGLLVSGGQFNQINIGPLSVNNLDVDATSSRFKAGLVWWK